MSAKPMETLEKDADKHRAQLADAIGDFTEALSPERVGRQAISDAAKAGRSATTTLARAAKDNPVALALVGMGAAMLIAGAKAGTQTPSAPSRAEPLEGQDRRIERAAQRMEKRQSVAAGRPPGPSASTMRKMLDKGLDKLGPDARDRVISLRLKAIDAQEAAERHARTVKRSAIDTHNSNPLVTGVVAAGIGGLLGALLPSTRKEAEVLGARRDALLRAAELRLRQEISQLEVQSKAAVSDAVRAGVETLHSKAS